jgi:hypothetical protein
MKGNNTWVRQRRADVLRRLRGELLKRDRELHILARRLADYQVHGKPEDAASFRELRAELLHRWIAEYVAFAKRNSGAGGMMKNVTPNAAAEFGVDERTVRAACKRNRHIVSRV